MMKLALRRAEEKECFKMVSLRSLSGPTSWNGAAFASLDNDAIRDASLVLSQLSTNRAHEWNDTQRRLIAKL